MVTLTTLDIGMDRPSAVALGFFDGVHKGHRAVIRRVLEQRQRGLVPCVFTFTFSGKGPASKRGVAQITAPKRRSQILEGMGVEYEIRPEFSLFCSLTPEEYVEKILAQRLRAQFVACGYDFRFGKGAKGDAALLRELCDRQGIELDVVAPVDDGGAPVSSTRIRELIGSGEMQQANRLMESPFSIQAQVIYGRQLGRQLSFPTINQPFDPDCLIPRYGVYASIACVEGIWRPGVTNVGVKPTVLYEIPLAETYIMGYEGDLYGKEVEVRLLTFLRPEQKFDSIEELKLHIAQDSEAAQKIADQFLASSGKGCGVLMEG